MFLVVFVTLMISIIDLYAQIIGLQSKRIAAHQNALAETMQVWHLAGVQLATNAMSAGTPPTTTPCLMTSGTVAAGMPAACTGVGAYDIATALAPTGYQWSPYRFLTMMYQSTDVPSTNMVITFAYATDAQGLLKLPDGTGTSVGYSLGDLSQQLTNMAQTNNGMTYGSVSLANDGVTHILIPHIPGTSYTAANPMAYVLPSTILTGSIALISAAQ